MFYVYVLFDEAAIPRYVGKGKGNRWLAHDRGDDPNNRYKNSFIRRTMAAIGEVPKVKVRDGLTEPQAFEIESALIKAIGRYPNGPLTNLTDNRNGPSSETIRNWHAGRPAEDRRASGAKTIATKRERYSAQELSETARRNALTVGTETLSNRMKKWRETISPEQASEFARQGGKASQLTWSEDRIARQIEALKRHNASVSREERMGIFQRGLGASTPEQLSEWGKLGAAKLNALLTPEMRSSASRKAYATRGDALNKEISRRGGLAAAKAMTTEKRRQAGRTRMKNMTPERRSEIALKGVATRNARKAAKLLAQDNPIPPETDHYPLS